MRFDIFRGGSEIPFLTKEWKTDFMGFYIIMGKLNYSFTICEWIFLLWVYFRLVVKNYIILAIFGITMLITLFIRFFLYIYGKIHF